MIFPIALFPKSESFHIFVRITERSVPIRGSFQIHVSQFRQIRSDNLIRIYENDFFHIQGKHNIQEKNFVTPNNSLFISLLVQPSRPFVLYILVLKSVFLGIIWQKIFQSWTKVTFQDPKFQGGLCGSFDTENHNFQKSLIQMTGSQTKYVEGFVFVSFISGTSSQS